MSGVIEEDIIMGSPGASTAGKGVYLDKDMLNDLLRTITAKSAPSFRVREPDLYRGERSSLVVTSWISSLETYFELVPMQEKEYCMLLLCFVVMPSYGGINTRHLVFPLKIGPRLEAYWKMNLNLSMPLKLLVTRWLF